MGITYRARTIRVQLPKTDQTGEGGVDYSQGFWVFARVLAKPKNKGDEPSNILLTPDPVLRVCNDGEVDFDGDGTLDDCPASNSDLMPLGLVTNEGVYVLKDKKLERIDLGTKGKGKVRATDITGLFTWTGNVCPDTLDTDGDGDIDVDDVLVDLDGSGVIDGDDLAILLASLCEFHNTEWVFNVADLVVQDVDLKNNGAKLLKVRFYPVATTEFTPTTPSIITQIHDESDGSIITGGTALPGTDVHDSAIVAAGTGPTPTSTVSFTFYTSGDCTTGGSDAGTVALLDGVAHPSDSRLALAAGIYSFSARYNGEDTDYEPADSSCEPLAIGESPLVTTEIHIDDGGHVAVTMAVTGDDVHDSATATGTLGLVAGTVSFTFYTGNDICGGPAVDAGTVALDGAGIAHPSLSQLDLAVGLYSFKAHYNGGSPYFPADSACEPLVVADP